MENKPKIPPRYQYYCDGSCYHTAKHVADQTMGMGLYFIESTGQPKPIYRRLAIEGPPGNHNNAEYLAIISAMYDLYLYVGAKRSDGSYIQEKARAVIHSDSQLVIRQIQGEYQTNKVNMSLLLDEVNILKNMLRELDIRVSFKWVPRETTEQKVADWLSKVGNPYFKAITADGSVAYQVKGPTPIETILLPDMYHRIKKGLKWN